ncbi:EthD domain-containing protein [Novosphingobium guangzhouense]|uniref:Ethyl tert-butyl ether degradation protein EthD n=1 Tax=Novosphingobium guangzhouense TaxID=1850347 RepID=A0A2K2G5P2_9SPHN|nr:EthD domain-containing protein [Novosphingobium guangzhouense]PNU06351.1 ethyl tert-butyl ether degradation protein EthD [Novosphingobium guangzhouense]
MHKILLFMKRRPDISVEAFRDYYETHHAPLAAKYSRGVTRYIRRYIDAQPHPETGAFTDGPDVITELWFADEKIFRATLAYITTSLMPDIIVEDEKNLFDRASFRIATVVEQETDLG